MSFTLIALPKLMITAWPLPLIAIWLGKREPCAACDVQACRYAMPLATPARMALMCSSLPRSTLKDVIFLGLKLLITWSRVQSNCGITMQPCWVLELAAISCATFG